jgi:hypothetical protein
MSGSDSGGHSWISSDFPGSTPNTKRQADGPPPADAAKQRDAERKRRERRDAAHSRATATINALVMYHGPVSMLTLTFPGDGADVPPVEQWRPMFHRWAEVMRYNGLFSWAVAVPHTNSTGKRNADVHVLCDLNPRAVARLEGVRGSTPEGQLANMRRAKLPPADRSLEEVATGAGFGRRIHWRLADDGAAPYLLGGQWQLARLWRSGSWTHSSETAGPR